MNFIDLGMIIIILISMALGYKRGVISSLIKLIGLIVIGIVAYSLAVPLSNFLLEHLNFFKFGGDFKDLFSINILFYRAFAFLFLFLMLYSLLNILINLAGIFDKLINLTVILYLPNKILGMIVGFLQGLIISFVLIFILVQMPYTHTYTLNSKYAHNILNRTPIIRKVLANTTNSVEEIYEILNNKTLSTEQKNQQIVSSFIRRGIITADKAQHLVDNNKLGMENIKFK